MTPQEIRDMSAAVAQFFGWWTPGKCTAANVHCGHLDEPWFNSEEDFKAKRWAEHEIPPPDLTQPEWFVRLLKVVRPHNLFFDHDMGHWECVIPGEERTADGPELALLKAAYEMVTQEQK